MTSFMFRNSLQQYDTDFFFKFTCIVSSIYNFSQKFKEKSLTFYYYSPAQRIFFIVARKWKENFSREYIIPTCVCVDMGNTTVTKGLKGYKF